MKRDSWTPPLDWSRTPRCSRDPAHWNPVERVTKEEIDAVNRDADRLLYFLCGVVAALIALGVLG